MKRRQVLRDVTGSFLALLCASQSGAQSSAKVMLIGLLDVSGERPELWDAFKQQLRELGYVEGRNVRFEQRYAKGNLDLLPGLAKELVQLKVAVIVTAGAAAALAAQRATRTIAIVMATGADQVGLGLAASLARPGGNVTGVSSLTPDLMAKRFELLREVVPKASRFAALWHADNVPSGASVRELDGTAAKAKVAFRSIGVRSAEELSDVFSSMSRERIDALIVINSGFIYVERKRIADLALKQKIAAMYGAAEYAEAGGLMSYAPSYAELFRRAAIYVDKVLKGADPANMPIEQATTFELVINANTARAIGVSIPATMLARANRVIQ
jgi:putative ABC transport system substrate-binding protein